MRTVDPFFTIWKILAIQAGVLAGLTVTTSWVWGWDAGRSAFLGSLVGFIPNLYFGIRVASAKGRTAKEILRTFYSGESMKMIITAGLFVLVFQIQGLSYVPLFAGFMAVVFVFWFALLFSRTEFY